MAKFTLPSGVVVDTTDEVGSRIYGATQDAPKPAVKKAAPKRQASSKSDDK